MSIIRRGSMRRQGTRAGTPKNRNVAPTLTPTERRGEWLHAVLSRSFGMDNDDALAISALVVERFGEKLELSDDEIPTEIRSIFYTLETKRILTFRRFEYKTEEGAARRGFMWRFNEAWNNRALEHAPQAAEASVYDELPANVWQRSAA